MLTKKRFINVYKITPPPPPSQNPKYATEYNKHFFNTSLT